MITELGGVNHKSVVAGFMFGDSNNLSVSVIGRTGYLMKREREREKVICKLNSYNHIL